MTAVIQLNPTGRYSHQELETFVSEIRTYVEREKEVMHAKEVAAFLGVSERTVFRSELPFHKVKGFGRIYLRSEVIDFIKKH